MESGQQLPSIEECTPKGETKAPEMDAVTSTLESHISYLNHLNKRVSVINERVFGDTSTPPLDLEESDSNGLLKTLQSQLNTLVSALNRLDENVTKLETL
jgi:hypothetical protein